MFTQTADLYDLIYAFKDYSAEAAKIRDLIAREKPGAKTILDVACGTGEHAKLLSSDFQVDGIDLEPKFVKIAQAKVPGGQFCLADMRSFDMGKKYDVVQCLFSSIGYLLSGEDIVKALNNFRKHLAPGGIVLVESWILPENFTPGRLGMDLVDEADLKICRMSVSKREGDISIFHFHYLIADKNDVRHVDEIHKLALVSVEQMKAHFESAGLKCTFDPVGPMGRGLYIAREI